jgi:capsular polysaccharide biosynthesis protein
MPVESQPAIAPTSAEPAAPKGVRRLTDWLVRGWPLVTAAGAIIVVQLMTTAGPSTYESTGSYIVRPQAPDAEGRIQATAMLNGTVRINSTFAQIAESQRTFDRALASLSPGDAAAERDADVDATITGSANILSISARTRRPGTAQALATAVGDETIGYVEGLSDLYDLGVLDSPGEATRSPEGVGTRALLAAGVAGLGVGLVTRPLVGRRFGRPTPSALRLDTGIQNERYTRLRLREERGRTNSTGVPFHLLVLQPDLPLQGGDVASLARVLVSLLREEDHVGYLSDARPRTFLAILPGRTDDEVRSLVTDVRDAAVERLCRRYGPHARAAVHSCSYRSGALLGDGEAIMVAEALS